MLLAHRPLLQSMFGWVISKPEKTVEQPLQVKEMSRTILRITGFSYRFHFYILLQNKLYLQGFYAWLNESSQKNYISIFGL